MCFIVDPKNKRAKIAEEDIVCYKTLQPDLSPAYSFNHGNKEPYILDRINERVKIKRRYDKDIDPIGVGIEVRSRVGEDCLKYKLRRLWFILTRPGYVVNEGYHSYKERPIYPHEVIYRHPAGGKVRVVKCIIPKGTKYYENEDDYVSETIIIDQILRDENN